MLWLTVTFMSGCCVGLLLIARKREPMVPPVIHTYAQLSAVTGIPVARLERLRVFAPEPEAECHACLVPSPDGAHCCTELRGHAGAHGTGEQYGRVYWGLFAPEPKGACLALSPDGQHRCTEPHNHEGSHRVQDQYGLLGWFDPPIVSSVFTPPTQASAAVADAAQWGRHAAPEDTRVMRMEQDVQWRLDAEERRAPSSEEDRLWRGGLIEALQWVLNLRHWPELPAVVPSVCTPPTQASAAVADAATWGPPEAVKE